MWQGWTLPLPVDKTFSALGEMALPLGLLGVGASIVTVKLEGHWKKALGSALTKTVVSPIMAWGVCRAFGLGAAEQRIIMILMAAPTAIISYSVALEMDGDETLAAGTIVLSLFASMVSLAVIVGFF
jgi:predicted permease